MSVSKITRRVTTGKLLHTHKANPRLIIDTEFKVLDYLVLKQRSNKE